MKNSLLVFILSFFSVQHISAQLLTDTVSIGTGYANQVWYSLPNGEQQAASKNNWDIAFDASGFGSSILINAGNGTTLWGYPNGSISKWSTLDTAGIYKWMNRWNSDTSWAYGAFNRYANLSNPYDLDWGIYSTITHQVTGDSLYVIKLANNAYKKLWIQSLAAGTYTFRYANLDGSADTTIQVNKSPYVAKNFFYYSLQHHTVLDREPAKASWDVLFTQYTAFLPTPYTVTGILHNNGVRVAKVDTVGNPITYSNYGAHKFKTAINEIGYNWKTFTGSTYEIEDSVVYFVKRNNGDVWKVIFTGFGGSANGNFIFSKQLLATAAIKNGAGSINAILALYPNPCSNGNVTILYDFEQPIHSAVVTVYDVSGQTIYAEPLNNTIGLHTHSFNTSNLSAGMYFVKLMLDGSTLQQKLIVK